jgi:putative ABC transport system ATP-binding protein
MANEKTGRPRRGVLHGNDDLLSTMTIQFTNVSVVVESKTILSNINFSVRKSGKVALVGKSGAGKSSVLHTLLGLVVPTAGEILFRRQKVDSASIDNVRASVAYIGQEPVLGSASTVREALMLPFGFKANRRHKPDEETIRSKLKLLDLDESILDRAVTVISGGEKQRIAICRALLQNKEVFLLDEVTSALDKESAQAVTALLTQERFTFLSVTHHDEWIDVCDTVIEMADGKIISVTNGAESGNN